LLSATSCYVGYLLYQRGTDVRLLKWEDVTPQGILFKPTKTEGSSGKKVLVPLSDDAKVVLARAKAIGKKRSAYVIHGEHGEPYTANGIAKLFKVACARLQIKNVTLRDIRAKAATDASTEGYTEAQLQVGLAHTDAATTRGYLKKRVVTVSELMMSLPPGTKTEEEK
jgi:integrase